MSVDVPSMAKAGSRTIDRRDGKGRGLGGEGVRGTCVMNVSSNPDDSLYIFDSTLCLYILILRILNALWNM